MNDIIVLAICLSAILICSMVSFLAYHLGAESQKHIDRMKIGKYFNEGYKKGYTDGCVKYSSIKKSKFDGKR